MVETIVDTTLDLNFLTPQKCGAKSLLVVVVPRCSFSNRHVADYRAAGNANANNYNCNISCWAHSHIHIHTIIQGIKSTRWTLSARPWRPSTTPDGSFRSHRMRAYYRRGGRCICHCALWCDNHIAHHHHHQVALFYISLSPSLSLLLNDCVFLNLTNVKMILSFLFFFFPSLFK